MRPILKYSTSRLSRALQVLIWKIQQRVLNRIGNYRTQKNQYTMKKLLLFVLAACAFVACEQAPIEEQSAIRNDAPETITVGFEDADTRIQLNTAQKTVWTKNDQVSVFYRSDANQRWEYTGATGARTAELKRVDAGTATETMKRVIVVYPYNDSYYLNTETFNVQASLPAVQHYLANSYGTDGNIMISASEYNQFSLKSVCGWLKIKLTGFGDVIKSIKVEGNNGEQVAGEMYINSADATAVLASEMGNTDNNNAGGTLVFDDTILYETTLDCGEGVELGLEATDFYIALPPQTFAKGITITVEDANGFAMTKSTDKVVTIDRNHILPMKSFTFVNPNNGENAVIGNNQIWYTASKQFTPYYDTKYYFGANLESNVWDEATGIGTLTFDGVVTMIGEYAFKDCTSLKSIVIPESVTSLGDGAFYGCSNITSITIPESVEEIGTYAFTLTKKLAKFEGKYASEDGRTLVKDGAIFAYAWASGDSYTFPEGVTSIADYAFYECDDIKRISIPAYVASIGNYAFCYCDGITEAYIDSSVIGSYAFGCCNSLKDLTLGDNVTEIGKDAFFECDAITEVTIPESVTKIGGYAFQYCRGLKEVYCKAITPATITGSNVFYDNASGRKIYVPTEAVEAYKSASYWKDYADDIVGYEFNSGGNDGIITENHKIYYTATKETAPYFNNSFYFGANLESNVWNAETGLGVLTFDGVVTMIGEYAFKNCTSLKSIVIPESVTSLGDGAFYGCENITSITIPEGVEEIGTYAFTYTKKLAKFEGKYASEDGRTLVKDGAIFAYAWASGDSYTIPEGVTAIAERAFYECDGIKRVSIPEYITTIGSYAFYECDGLTEAYVDSSVIGSSAFRACDYLNDLTLGDNVTEIGNLAFYSCDAITEVTIPESVTKIGGEAFSFCNGLKEVYCKATTPATITGINVFNSNASGRKIYVPVDAVEAYKSAWYWRDYADDIVGYEF